MRVLECSSRGTKEFSALYAKVSVLGVYRTIEEHYQLSKRFGDYAPKTWRDAKGKRPSHISIGSHTFPVTYLTAWYSLLWVMYFLKNRQLLDYAKQFDEFNDMFAVRGNNNQAEVIRTIVKDGFDCILNDEKVREINNKCFKESAVGMQTVHLYTDGACSGNPGPGGWGVYLALDGSNIYKELSGYESSSTNQRMELVSAIEGLSAIKKPCKIVVYSDSNYVVKGINEWVQNWVLNEWKGSSGKVVSNVELWKRLWFLVCALRDQGCMIQFKHVPGHSGIAGNERADTLARNAIKRKES